MPYRILIRDAFEPEQIDAAVRAYELALDVVLSSENAADYPDVKRNIALQIIAVGKESADFSIVDMTNWAVRRYFEKRKREISFARLTT